MCRGMQRCMEVHRGAQRYIEGYVEMCGCALRCTGVYMEVHRGVHRGV